jgi:hypothetical protein
MKEEHRFAARLNAQFAGLSAPNDGDCLFHSAYVASLSLDYLKKVTSL